MEEYLLNNYMTFEKVDEDLFIIDGKRFLFVKPTNGLLFNEDFQLILSPVQKSIKTDFYAFCFGGRFYYTESQLEPTLTPLKYLGNYSPKLGFNYSFLGVHGGYELLNGSRLYDDWAMKAKFLGVYALGICERNTLAGALIFQKSCEKFSIKPIIGEEISVRDDKDYQFNIKLYPRDDEGWRRLLLMNKEINIDNNGFVRYKSFLEYIADGNFFIVLDPKYIDYERAFPIELNFECFYQLDPVEYVQNDRDEWYLKNLKKFVRSHIPPIAISDAYYIDKEDFFIKKYLNTIANKYDYDSKNQFFRSIDEYFNDVMSLFNPEDETAVPIFMASIENLKKVVSGIQFKIPTGERHLPKYELTKEEFELYGDSETLFWSIIENGLKNKVPLDKQEEYINRLQEEYSVIKMGDVVDYFLILWDIINWAKRNDIVVGIARGSAGGSLISMLMGITELDPIKFDLLFSRFLNEGRITKSLPDIDTDFESEKRGLVKSYIEKRYGKNYVCSVGTYTKYQVKGILKDFSKIFGAKFDDVNIITKKFSGDETFIDLFKLATTDKKLKKFIISYPEVINAIPLVYGQPKAGSIHACAMVIFPKSGTMFEHVPMRLHDNEIVSEWEGAEIESSGYLKEDILGVRQLDKFGNIIRLIRENHKIDIDITQIPLDCEKTFMNFHYGLNSDVFHFGSSGLTQYCLDLKPINIEDLIAGISLYRPGAMESNYHNEFIKLRRGEKGIEYMWGTENATKKTFGLLVYQEQIMQIFVDVGGFSHAEADDVRRAMVKKNKEYLQKYKERFLENAIKIGCPKLEAENIWEKLERFAEYGFNRSHAAAYAITGYISQWFKVHYPIEFWATAFKYATEEQYPSYISEIYFSGGINIVPPDINSSGKFVSPNFETNSIHWGILSIRDIGDVASDQIISIRDSVGKYFSFEDFVQRNVFRGSKVDKRIIENLIMSGAFDIVEGISNPIERFRLVEQYYELTKRKMVDGVFFENADFISEDWWWVLQQKRLCGVAFFNYKELCERLRILKYPYIDSRELRNFYNGSKKIKSTVAGYVIEVNVRNSKKGEYADITIESNYNFIVIKVWAEQWAKLSDILSDSEKKILVINGIISWDDYKSIPILTANEATECFVLG